jgi:hypothetical protein
MMPVLYILGTAAIAVITFFLGWYTGYESGRWMELERQRRDGRQ